ncbi:MAG TPA: hypothetical protein VFB59_00505, partial [Candidatus Saccharimonadales bacterium]|nr:hypothetical protein [Candidatus Saccharimonadales bacterium]
QKQSKESGIAHILLVLLIVLVTGAIIGGAWYVWQQSNDKSSSDSTTQNEMKEDPKVIIPDGWEFYKNDDAGFSFYYPPQWGHVQNTQSGSLQFSLLKELRFQANRRDKNHTQGHFGVIQLNNVIDVSTENSSANVVFLTGNNPTTRKEVFAQNKIIKSLPNSHACVLDEVSVYESYINDSELINSYTYFSYCGLVSSTYGAVSFTSGSLDITDSKTQKFKEEMTKLLQTFETF